MLFTPLRGYTSHLCGARYVLVTWIPSSALEGTVESVTDARACVWPPSVEQTDARAVGPVG